MKINTLLLAGSMACAAGARTMPVDYFDGMQQQSLRSQNITRAYAEKYILDGKNFGTDIKKGLRFITAGFYVFANPSGFPGDLPARLGGMPAFRSNALVFLRTYLKATADVGTDADYDLTLNEVMALLQNCMYMYDRTTGQYIMNKDIAWEIVCQDGGKGGCNDADGITSADIASFSGQALQKKKSFVLDPRFPGVTETYSETENHVLAIHSWRYLINNYVRFVAGLGSDHHLYDSRIVQLYNLKDGSGITHYNNEAGSRPLKDWVLQTLGRPLHNGMFEQNARPYAGISWQAIANLYIGADRLWDGSGYVVQQGARNALEFLSALYAFQSFEGKRMSPMRRQWEYRRRRGIGNNDYLMDIMAAMTGAYVFEDAWNNVAKTTDGYYVSRYSYQNINGPEVDKAQGYALWACLLADGTQSPSYQPASAIVDFMYNKRSGYTTRAMTQYTNGHYGKDQDARYFTGPTTAYKSGTLNSSPEFYFTTPTYINSSGGYARAYYPNPAGLESLKTYNFLSFPQSLITRGDIGRYWGTQGEDQYKMYMEVLHMLGNSDLPFESKNLWTYKNFAYGYIHNQSGTDFHVTFPQFIPYHYGPIALPQFSINGRGQFQIYDLRNVEVGKGTPVGTKYGFYAVIGMASKSDLSQGQFYEYGRGFWEIVPGNLFASPQALKDRIIAYNPASHFTNNTSEHYFYKLAVSGDKLKLDNKMGASSSCQSIMAIWDHTGAALPLATEMTNNCSETDLRTMPLLEAREVDANYRYTGVKFVEAPANGIMTVRNPYLGQTVVINSNDYTNPFQQYSWQ